mmetsp:Transcript_42041/g.61462  ORF Transcript_42041/g.61462 Transcript_42041/m.61462 type:complete len:84 (-) Transcript_42041:848-1099(-)
MAALILENGTYTQANGTRSIAMLTNTLVHLNDYKGSVGIPIHTPKLIDSHLSKEVTSLRWEMASRRSFFCICACRSINSRSLT